jgi:hypothetical protein
MWKKAEVARGAPTPSEKRLSEKGPSQKGFLEQGPLELSSGGAKFP